MPWCDIGRADFCCPDCGANWTNTYQYGYFQEGECQSGLQTVVGQEWHEQECRFFSSSIVETAHCPQEGKGIGMERTMDNILLVGKTYDPEQLELLGWTEGDGSGSEGYSYLDYFDADGRYLGPDAHGIEPLFSCPEE